MSRAGDLYWRAAAKATAPVRRFYFDTEPLRHGNWPFKSTMLGFCLRLADKMGAEIWVPEPALHERAEQWIRETLAALSETSAKANSAQKALQSVGLDLTLQLPTEELLRAKYMGAERAAIRQYSVQQSPYPSRPVDEIFRMAVAREFTFEERKDGVIGLQDCIILLSVLDHLKGNPASSAFVSNDGVFCKIPALVATGTELRLIRGLTELEKILNASVADSYDIEFKRLWDELTARITQVLTANRNEIQAFLEQNTDPGELESLFSARVVSKEPPSIESFGAIHPEMKGEADDPIIFSCDLRVSYTATVEERLVSLGALFGSRFYGDAPQATAQVVVRERSTTVELSAQINPDYTNLKLHAARIRA